MVHLIGCIMVSLPLHTAADGEKYAPKDGHFTVRFPGKPKESKQSTKTETGTLDVVTATYAFADGNVYVASYTKFPAEVVKPEVRGTLFDGVVKGLKGKDGTVTSEKEIEIGSEKGREVLIDKGKAIARYRILVKDDRLIQLGAVGMAPFATARDATVFFESLELK
jgi:hypothetical protein